MSQKPSQEYPDPTWTVVAEGADRLSKFFIGRTPPHSFWTSPANRRLLAAQPKVDIAASDDELVVTTEVPGLKIGDLDISVTDDVMTLHAHESDERDQASVEGSYRPHQIVQGSFVRHIRLPCAVDAENASASYQDGMLRVLFPNAIPQHQSRGKQNDQDNVLTVYFGVAR